MSRITPRWLFIRKHQTAYNSIKRSPLENCILRKSVIAFSGNPPHKSQHIIMQMHKASHSTKKGSFLWRSGMWYRRSLERRYYPCIKSTTLSIQILCIFYPLIHKSVYFIYMFVHRTTLCPLYCFIFQTFI